MVNCEGGYHFVVYPNHLVGPLKHHIHPMRCPKLYLIGCFEMATTVKDSRLIEPNFRTLRMRMWGIFHLAWNWNLLKFWCPHLINLLRQSWLLCNFLVLAGTCLIDLSCISPVISRLMAHLHEGQSKIWWPEVPSGWYLLTPVSRSTPEPPTPRKRCLHYFYI